MTNNLAIEPPTNLNYHMICFTNYFYKIFNIFNFLMRICSISKKNYFNQILMNQKLFKFIEL